MKFIQNNFSFEDQEKAETEIMSEVWHWSKADPPYSSKGAGN